MKRGTREFICIAHTQVVLPNATRTNVFPASKGEKSSFDTRETTARSFREAETAVNKGHVLRGCGRIYVREDRVAAANGNVNACV